MTTETVMPPAIIKAVFAVARKAHVAKRGEVGESGQRYAGVNDIYDALHDAMLEVGMITEMVLADKGFDIMDAPSANADKPELVSLIFRLRITLESGEVYSDPVNLWPVVAPIEGASTTIAARTMAHRSALRDLFKIRVEDADAVHDGSRQNGSGEAPTQNGARRGRPRKDQSATTISAMYSPEESTARAKIIIAALNAQTNERELKDAFRANAGDIGRLLPADHESVSMAFRLKTGEINAR